MTLTAEEEAAVRLYSSSYHALVNACLRGEEACGAGVLATIAALDSALVKSPLAVDVELFRGVDGDVASYMTAAGLYVGSVLENDGFVSTSADASAALLFAIFPPGGLLLRIRAPAGTLALDMAGLSDYPDEREFLLPRGTRLRVVAYDEVARILDTEVA